MRNTEMETERDHSLRKFGWHTIERTNEKDNWFCITYLRLHLVCLMNVSNRIWWRIKIKTSLNHQSWNSDNSCIIRMLCQTFPFLSTHKNCRWNIIEGKKTFNRVILCGYFLLYLSRSVNINARTGERFLRYIFSLLIFSPLTNRDRIFELCPIFWYEHFPNKCSLQPDISEIELKCTYRVKTLKR